MEQYRKRRGSSPVRELFRLLEQEPPRRTSKRHAKREEVQGKGSFDSKRASRAAALRARLTCARSQQWGGWDSVKKNESLRKRGVGKDKSSPASRRARPCGSFARQHSWLRCALLARE
eukprot:6212282-Pleurochrysis_carterae.AAC.3